MPVLNIGTVTVLPLVILCDMKTVISIPEGLFKAVEKMAHQLNISRSELCERALLEFLQQRDKDVRASLDRVYARKRNRGLDPLVRTISEQLIMDEQW